MTVPLELGGIIEYCAAVTDGLTENERVHVFMGSADRAELKISPNPDEVCEVRWALPADLRREAAACPSAFAPWFRIYLTRWDELGI